MHIADTKTRKALLYGRYDIHLETGKYVHNLYQLNGEVETSPLLGLRILQALRDGIIRHGDTKSRFMAVDELFTYFNGMGFDRRVTSLWLDALLKKGLVLNYDPTCLNAEDATQVEISPKGDLHWFWAGGNYDYVFAMAEVTTIRDQRRYEDISRVYNRGTSRRFRETIAEFSDYLTAEDGIYCVIPDHDSYSGQREVLGKLAKA